MRWERRWKRIEGGKEDEGVEGYGGTRDKEEEGRK